MNSSSHADNGDVADQQIDDLRFELFDGWCERRSVTPPTLSRACVARLELGDVFRERLMSTLSEIAK